MAIPITDDMMSSGECLAKFQRPDMWRLAATV